MSSFDDEKDKPDAPTMVRSRGQLSSSYAPGAFFTFEGGLGACISQPDFSAAAHEANISVSVKNQILMRLDDAVKSWYGSAIGLTVKPPQPVVMPEQCVDSSLLNSDYSDLRPMDRGRYVFVNPGHMGYAPAPLTFVCNHCGRFRRFDNAKDFGKNAKSRLNVTCLKSSNKCQWRQLDVVFVHWSGNWEPVRPGKWGWDNKGNKLREPFDRCQLCHESDFILETAHSQSSIGKWYFRCGKCGNPDYDGWVKNDHDTLDILKENFIKYPAQAHMEPISYRASAAYYAQSDQFILFDEEQAGLLSIANQPDLAAFIASHFGYGSSRPSMAEIESILSQTENGREQWKKYSSQMAMLEKIPNPAPPPFDEMAATMREGLKDMVNRWFTEGTPPLLKEENHLPAGVTAVLASRKDDYDQRYDPFRLIVEHEALRRNHLDVPREATGRSPFVHFNALDYDLSPKDETEKARIEAEASVEFKKLGMGTMGLIRNFKLCRFTYGYTRVGSQPVIEKHGMQVPVRLRLFETVKVENGYPKHPIYVVTQENEAIYVRLDENVVYQWIKQLNLSMDDFEWHKSSGIPLGALLLERALPMQRFLSNIHPKQDPRPYYYIYTLLHTYAHIVMRAVAEHSGLDLGSMGEYIFPADLAFVVYRNGTTMDLGNLSSLWRNENIRFLKYLAEPRTLSCNSGSLCSASGGACPDCILIPETSCIAANQLLSRSVLRGGNPPREDGVSKRIRGYLEVANASPSP